MSLVVTSKKSSLDGVAKALEATIREMEEKGYVRSVHSNVLIKAGRDTRESEVERWLGSFSLVHPSRFFVIRLDNSRDSIEVETGARCHLVSSAATVCSEVLYFTLPQRLLPAVPSVIRSHLISAAPVELFLLDKVMEPSDVESILPLASAIYFDSGYFESPFETASYIGRSGATLIDLAWISLWPWRDHIKLAFERPGVTKDIASITTIKIVCSCEQPQDMFASYLLAGWILHRLRLEPVAFGSRGFECRGVSYRATPKGTVAVEIVQDSKLSGISSTEFIFEGGIVRIQKSDHLETIVQGEHSIRSLAPIEEFSPNGLLERYFLLGESTANYRGAFRIAMELRRIQRGFL